MLTQTGRGQREHLLVRNPRQVLRRCRLKLRQKDRRRKMNSPVGYLIKRKDGLEGVRGTFYDYVLAENGVFIEAEGPLLAARVPVVHGQVRGLEPLEPKLILRYGLIPQRFFDLAINLMISDVTKEQYTGVSWDDGYHIYTPEQKGTGGGVEYAVGDSIVLDLHSHGMMKAWFSTTDNKDETGLRLYGVVGKLDKEPEVRLRVGVYGSFHPISWGEVFEGSLDGVLDGLEIPLELDEEEIKRPLDWPSADMKHHPRLAVIFDRFRRH